MGHCGSVAFRLLLLKTNLSLLKEAQLVSDLVCHRIDVDDDCGLAFVALLSNSDLVKIVAQLRSNEHSHIRCRLPSLLSTLDYWWLECFCTLLRCVWILWCLF